MGKHSRTRTPRKHDHHGHPVLAVAIALAVAGVLAILIGGRVTVLTGAAASDTQSAGTVTITGCLRPSGRLVHVSLDTTATCPPGTTQISWQVQEITPSPTAAASSEAPSGAASLAPAPESSSPPSPSPSATTAPTVTPSAAATSSCGTVQPSWAAGACLPVTLDDEFNGTALGNTWTPGWFGTGTSGPVNSLECSRYDSANVSVSGGFLHLGTYAIVSSNPGGGAHPGFTFTHGAIEFRAFIPALSGSSQIANWPALWVNGPDGAGRGEFDVMEGINGTAKWHIPTDGNPGGTGPNPPYSGWHTFGVAWTGDGTVTFYYDGLRAGQVTGVPNTGPMYVVMGNQCRASTRQPGTDLLVDWVHGWALPGAAPSQQAGTTPAPSGTDIPTFTETATPGS